MLEAISGKDTLNATASAGEASSGPVWAWLKDRLDFGKYVPRPVAGSVSERFESKRGTYYILRSPTGQYMRMDPADFFLWSQMDGAHTIANIALAYFYEFHAFAFARLKALTLSLHRKGFLDESPTYLYAWMQLKMHDDGVAAWGNRIAQAFVQREFAIPGLDGILTRLYRGGVRFLFLKPLLWLYSVIAVLGLGLFTNLVVQGRYSLISNNNSLGLGLLSLYAGLIIIVMLHEGAHAFTVKHCGREVRRGGAMIYLGSLAFFIETQDIWLSGKKSRIAVSGAGPFMNLIVGGILSGVILLFPALPLNEVLFKLAALAYVTAVFNLNPLIELDGYFMLMDWLEIPALRQRSLGFLREKLLAKFKAREKFSPDERIFMIFGLLATAYTAYVLGMSLFIVQQRAVPMIVNLWNMPGAWGKLLVGGVVLVGLVPLGYSMLRRLYQAIAQGVAWLAGRGLFASQRNVALLLLAPAVLFHLVPWALGTGQSVAELGRPLILLPGIGTAWLILRGYDRSYLQRAMLALAIPLLICLVAECVGLTQWPGSQTYATVLRAAGLLSCTLAACVSFDPDYLKLASPLERGLVAMLLPTGVVAGILVSVGLLTRSVTPPVSILIGATVGIALVDMAILLSLVASFWRSHLRYAWLYVMLALGVQSVVVVWDAMPLFQKGVGGAFSLAVWFGYSCLSGALVLYYLTQTQAYAQLRPVDLKDSSNIHDQLTQVVQHLLESMLAQYQVLFGERRLKVLQGTLNAISASARWGLVVDQGRLTVLGDQSEAAHLALTYQQLLDQAIALLQQGGGQRFARQTLQRAYDSLPWESRELTNEYILQGAAWGAWLSHQFKETQHHYAALLSRVPVFFHCAPEEIDAISARLVERTYPAGATIIRQGDVGDEFHIVKSGKVTVWQKDDKGWNRLVNEHNRGDTFGELALLHDALRNATCVAATPVTTLALGRQDFQMSRHHFEIQHKLEQSIQRIQALQCLPLFAETPVEQLHQIAARLATESFEAGQVFVRQGEEGDKFYIIQEGQVEVFTTNGDGGEELVARRGRGEHVGEVALLLNVPRTASMRTVTPSTLLSLTRDEFLELVNRDAEIYQGLERVSTRRMRSLPKSPQQAL